MRLRKAVAADHPEMLRIWLEASRIGHPFLGEETLREQLAAIRDIYLPHADNWVAEDERLAGFIGLIANHVGGLFVNPDAHRRGVGRRLVEHAAARLGELTVEVYERNVTAATFYRNCGFEDVERKERDEEGRPFPLLRMRRPAPGAARQLLPLCFA